MCHVSSDRVNGGAAQLRVHQHLFGQPSDEFRTNLGR
jgi:hypothetical protein